MTAASIVQIGQYLSEVKARIGHGHFLEWIAREFDWSEPSAQRFMRVYANVKSVNLTDMKKRSANTFNSIIWVFPTTLAQAGRSILW